MRSGALDPTRGAIYLNAVISIIDLALVGIWPTF
jgi:hypothetical protein